MLIAAAVCPHPPLLIPEATWQVLAGAAGQDAFDAELRYRGAPYEVNYVVASWRRSA
jgi:hypothetical protein